ncbi:PleD family two-component system response regulator [Candidatus Omnitrophota bacterium]
MANKILLIDDDPIIVKVVKSRLEASSYKVISASNGSEGLEKAVNEHPDLIILDIMMPEMDGYAFVKEIKSNPSAKHIPIIILTVKDKMKDLFEMEGVKDYLIKPFKEEDLLEKIKKHLEK